MYKAMTAYKLKDSKTVVSRKDALQNTQDSDFEEVRLFVGVDEVKQWAEEIELMELDEE